MPTRIFLILLLLQGFFSFAHAKSIPYTGVWGGAIGTQKVRVCFTTHDDSQYYYLKHLRGIRLRAEDTSANDDDTSISGWREVLGQEEKTTGTWELEKLADGSLAGAWHDPQSNKRLDIKLNKIGELENNSCGIEFYRPIKESASERTKHWNVFFLPSSYRGAGRFNSYVRSWLIENAIEDYECQLRYGNNRELALVQEVLIDQVLVIRETLFDVYCGGAHNGSGTSYQFFNPQTGEQIDTWKWIKGGESAVRASPATRLRVLIEKLNPEAAYEGCRDGFDVRPPYPTKNGFKFPTNFSWAARICDSTVLIPYEKLTPYLTAEGKAVAASIHGH